MVPLETERGTEEIPYTTSKVFSVSVEVDSLELQSINSSYQTDKYFQKVQSQLKAETQIEVPRERSQFPQFQMDTKGLIYFCDWNDNLRLCIGGDKTQEIIAVSHSQRVLMQDTTKLIIGLQHIITGQKWQRRYKCMYRAVMFVKK